MNDQNTTTETTHEGFVPLMRRFRFHPFWTEPRRFSRAEAWIDLLFRAHYSEKPETIVDRGEEITLNEGDVLTSMLTLSKDWRRSRTFVKNFIKTLEKNGEILINRMDNRRLIIHIVKFAYFKRLIQQNGQQTLQQSGQQKSNRKTHKNKDNKENKENIKYLGNIPKDLKNLKPKIGTGITKDWQELAFRYANYLNIKLSDPDLKARWLKFFKENHTKKVIHSALSFLVDYPPFQELKEAEHKIKYFFAYCFKHDN